MNMNRFNAFLAVFAILLITWLIVDGPPRPPDTRSTAATLQPPSALNILAFDILSNGMRITAERSTADADVWQVNGMPPTYADDVAFLIDRMLIDFVVFDTIEGIISRDPDGLQTYGLALEHRQYTIAFVDSAATAQPTTFAFIVGNATPDQQEYYTVFVNPNTGSYQGESVYTVPSVYIESLDELINLLAEQSQSRGQTTEP